MGFHHISNKWGKLYNHGLGVPGGRRGISLPFSDSFARTSLGTNWLAPGGTITAERLAISPTLGNELVVASHQTYTAVGRWVTFGSNVLSVDNGAIRVDYVDNAAAARLDLDTNTLTSDLQDNVFYEVEFDVKVSAGGTIRANVNLTTGGDNQYKTITSTDYVRYKASVFGGSSTRLISLLDFAGGSVWLTNLSVKAISLPTAIATINKALVPDVSMRANIYAGAMSTQTGIILNVDNPANPQNWVMVTVVGYATYNIRLYKCVGGDVSQILTTGITYSDGALLEVYKDGTSYSIYYNAVQVGTTQTISDASVINNQYHGVVNTDVNATIDTVSCYDTDT